MGERMRLLSGSLNAEADFYRGNETPHYQSFRPRILGTEIPRSEIWRCVDWKRILNPLYNGLGTPMICFVGYEIMADK